MLVKFLCILFCITFNSFVVHGAKLNTIDIQGSLQQDSSASRQPKFLFGVRKFIYKYKAYDYV